MIRRDEVRTVAEHLNRARLAGGAKNIWELEVDYLDRCGPKVMIELLDQLDRLEQAQQVVKEDKAMENWI